MTTPDGNTVAYDCGPAGNRTGLHSAALDQAFDFDEVNRLHAVHSRVLGDSRKLPRQSESSNLESRMRWSRC